MNTIFAPLCDHLGLASRKEVTETRYGPLLTQAAWASPASEYRRVQPEKIPVDPDHDGRAVGQVVHLERSRAGTLWAVAHVDERLRFASWVPERYWPPKVSARRDGGTHRDIELLSVAITIAPCQTGLRPLVELRGELDHGDAHKRWRLAEPVRGLIQRANAAHRERRRNGGPIMIRDVAELKATKLARSQLWIDEDGEPLGMTSLRSAAPSEYRPPGRWRIRPCTILRVS